MKDPRAAAAAAAAEAATAAAAGARKAEPPPLADGGFSRTVHYCVGLAVILAAAVLLCIVLGFLFR
jgi:hypothetical protein